MVETAKNIQKREVAASQLIAHVHDVTETTKLAIKGVVIGGDFNTNHGLKTLLQRVGETTDAQSAERLI